MCFTASIQPATAHKRGDQTAFHGVNRARAADLKGAAASRNTRHQPRHFARAAPDGQRQPQQSAFVETETSTAFIAPTWPGNPALLLTALSGLAAITADLFAPWGARWLMQTIDQPTHAWVVSTVPKFFRDLVFEIGVSNVVIIVACAGWAVGTGILLSDATDGLKGGETEPEAETDARLARLADLKARAKGELGIAWALYVAAGGFIVPGDNLLVGFIKRALQRVRPSTRHKSFSFPSGHTTAVTYLVGTLLFVLIPRLLELAEARATLQGASPSVSDRGLLANEGLRRLATAAVSGGGRLWSLAILSTAAGRVLGDVHWVTDTAAGACLGIALVSGFTLLSRRADARR